MSCSYADGLSPYENKGKLGLAEKFDSEEEISRKVVQLAAWIKEADHVVVHTGAGISTSAGIPDFRGPNGVWTLEAKGLKPEKNVAFDEAVPTKTHMALLKLVKCGLVKYIISQNIDGLHLRSGLPRKNLAELHGNMFVEQCNHCGKQFVRGNATTSVGQKCLNKPCPAARGNGRPCRGRLHDTILDWEHNLPESDLQMSDYHSSVADLSLCLGTTLQIIPSGNLPLATKKCNGRLVICNLQPTKHDRKADLIINSYVDDVLVKLMKTLELSVESYNTDLDPSFLVKTSMKNSYIEWTIESELVKHMKAVYERKRKQLPKKNGKRKMDDNVCAKLCKTELNNTTESITLSNADLKRKKYSEDPYNSNSVTEIALEHASPKREDDMKPTNAESGGDDKLKNEVVNVYKIKANDDGNKQTQFMNEEGTKQKVETTVTGYMDVETKVDMLNTLIQQDSNRVHSDHYTKEVEKLYVNRVEEMPQNVQTCLPVVRPEDIAEIPSMSTLEVHKKDGNETILQPPVVNQCKLENINSPIHVASKVNLSLGHIKVESIN